MVRNLFRVTVICGIAAVLTAGIALSAGPAMAAPEGSIQGTGEPGVLRERYIVVLKPDAVPAAGATSAADNLSKRFGGKLQRAFSKSVRGFTVRMSEARAKRLAANPLVDYVQADRMVPLAGSQSNPPWGLDRIDQANRPLYGAYTYPNTASNVTAYIVDTGVRVSHVDFQGRARSGYDFVDGDADASDCNGHGTHVAGTVGGAQYGVAKGVQLVGVRVLNCSGYGSYSSILAGIEWVTANAVRPAVVNMSLGGDPNPAMDQAIRASISAGLTYVVAAGNSNVDACTVSPSRVVEAITVGATDTADVRAGFSNYGGCLDLFAPGVSVLSSTKDSDTATGWMSGTSMAAPHVAGAAALILGASPATTPAQVREGLVAAATSGVVSNVGGGSPNRLLYNGAGAQQAPPAGNPAPAAPAAPATPATPAVPGAVTPCYLNTNGGDVWVRDRAYVTSPIAVANCAAKASRTSRVEVHVVHPRRGDVVVELIAPNGAVKRFKAANKRDAKRDVHAAWTVNLAAYNRNGVWKVRVRDSYKGNVGYLDSWTLRL